MPSLLVFNRVYRLEIQSVMMVFSPGFMNYYPSNLLSVCSSPTPLPIVNKYEVYSIHVYVQCVGGGGGHRGEGASDR